MASGRGCDVMRVGLESAHKFTLWRSCETALTQAATLVQAGPREARQRRAAFDRTMSARIESIECRYQSTLSTHHQTTRFHTHTPWPRPSEHCALRSAHPSRARCPSPASLPPFLAPMPQPPSARLHPTSLPTRLSRPARIFLERMST